MKKCLLIAPLLFLLSCSVSPDMSRARLSKGNSGDPVRGLREEQTHVKDFDRFLDRFNRDSVFQLNHVNFPLRCRSWANDPEDMDRYDLLEISREEYGIEFLADTIGNYIPGLPTFAKTEKKGKEYVVTIQVEDSGIHVSYFFRYTSKWELYLIEDSST